MPESVAGYTVKIKQVVEAHRAWEQVRKEVGRGVQGLQALSDKGIWALYFLLSMALGILRVCQWVPLQVFLGRPQDWGQLTDVPVLG